MSDVRFSHSTIKDVLGISSIYLSTSLIECTSVKAIGGQIDTLFGNQINYTIGSIDNLTSSNIQTKSLSSINLSTGSLLSGVISSITQSSDFLETKSFYANGGVISTLAVQYLAGIDTLVVNKTAAISNLKVNTLSSLAISTQSIYADLGTISSLYTNYISSGIISSGILISKEGYFSTLYTDTLFIKNIENFSSFSTINTFVLSTNQIITSSINAGNGVFNDISCNNLDAASNLNGFNMTIRNNQTVVGTLEVDGKINANCDLEFPTNTVYTIDHPFTGLTQYQKDVINVRNFNAEQISVVGGATGNTIEPPYRNNSVVTIGNADGVIDEWLGSPAIVTINGVNGYVPGIDTNTTTALTVRGDLDVDYGVLTTYNGANFYPYDATANAISAFGDVNTTGALTVEGETNLLGLLTAEGSAQIVGYLNTTGLTNALGGLSVEGVANFAGGVTCEAGIGIIGALGLTGGNITFGSSIDTGNLFTNYNGTLLSNGLTVYGNTTFNGAVNIKGQENISSLSTFQVTTNSLKLFETGGSLARIDFFNSNNYGAPSNSILQYESNLLIDSANSIYTAAIGEYHIYGNCNVMINSSNDIIISNVNATHPITLYGKEVVIPTQLQVSSVSTLYVNGDTTFNSHINLCNNNIVNVNTLDCTYNGQFPSINLYNQSNLPLGTLAATYDDTLSLASISTLALQATKDIILYTNKTNIVGAELSVESVKDISIKSFSTLNLSADTQIVVSTQAFLLNCSTVIKDAYVEDLLVKDLVANTINTQTLSTLTISSGSVLSESISTTNISTNAVSVSNINARTISTNNISTGNLYAGVISSLQMNASSINANRLGIDRITGVNNGFNTFTNNLFPNSAGSQLGYNSGGTVGGGFYNTVNARSTSTQVIFPSGEAGRFQNTIYIQSNVSTQNVMVSSINNKLYPYTSTLNSFLPPNTVSTYTISGTSATTPIILVPNIRFPILGNYLISNKNTITKASGGVGAEPYGSLCVSRGLFPSTFATQDGFNLIPYMNALNVSSFNTFTTSVSITDPTQMTRNLTYYDQSGHNYILNMALADIRLRYLPTQGFSTEFPQ